MSHSRHVFKLIKKWSDRLAGIIQMTLHHSYPTIDSLSGNSLRVIVTPAVYPRLVELLHFDIQRFVYPLSFLGGPIIS